MTPADLWFCARSCLLLLGVFLGDYDEVRADCEIEGRVMSPGGPLSGVRVSLPRDSATQQVAVSALNGRFSFEIAALPAHVTRLRLDFEKDGFEPVSRLSKPRTTDRCPVLEPDHVQMEPIPDAGASDASTTGNTVFVATHAIHPEQHQDIETARNISKRFGEILYHYISSYVSSLTLGTAYDYGFRHLDKPLPLSDVELIRKEGRKNNALAVIAGEGDVVDAGDQGQRFDLISGFRIIPMLSGYQERHLHLQDSLRLRDASALSISRDLRDLWGQKTVVALVVRDLAEMSPPYDEQRLLQARNTLQQVDKTISEEDAIYPEVQALLKVVDKGLGQ